MPTSESDALPRPGRYIAPASWQLRSLAEVLEATPRNNLTAKQLSLLGSADQREAPMPIYLAGDIGLLSRPCVAVIGTRQVSPHGAARARRLAKELVQQGVVVVSGLAEGVDTAAMSSAIQHGGRTVGVIGTPIDQAYPASNRELQQEVYRDHLLVSQFESGSRVHRSNFPQRNRLMATLSDATVVIEASDTSGTLHQAAECTRLGRWLFITRSVVEDPGLSWPRKFASYARCRTLDSTDDLLREVYSA